MRQINRIIVHCSATREGQNVTVNDIKKWHVRDNKWKNIGYHYVIHLDGSIHLGRDESEIGAHVANHNKDSIGICYVGGVDLANKAKDTRTDAQKRSLEILIRSLLIKYPKATIHGHREFAAKDCPSFDVAEYKHLEKQSAAQKFFGIFRGHK